MERVMPTNRQVNELVKKRAVTYDSMGCWPGCRMCWHLH